MPAMHILVVEDERKISSFLVKGLRAEGYTVDLAENGSEGLTKALTGNFAIIILDIMLPLLDGLTVCKTLRQKKIPTPIIMLTAKDTLDDKLRGFEHGADDYMVKPFSFAELLARIKSVLNRHIPANQEILSCQDLSLNIEKHEVQYKGKNIEMSATEFRLLEFMLRNTQRVVSKQRILEEVWGYDFDPESNIVEVYIKYLRNKIDKGHKAKLIHTIRGVGYRLCASK
jgi:DNA-binding response OmpR family regulator